MTKSKKADVLRVEDLQHVVCKQCGEMEDGILDNKGQGWCGRCWEKLVAKGLASREE